MKVALLTSGGDSPGINAFIKSLYNFLYAENIDLYGVYRGYQGLVANTIKKINKEMVLNISNQGGTILKTSKYNPFESEENINLVLKNLEQNGIDYLLVCGDFDTLRIAGKLSEKGLKILAIPQTIDNDIPETDFSLGFYSAIRNIVNSVEIIRSTNESHERDILVEIMGKETGWLTVFTALSIKTEGFFIPERPCKLEDIADIFKKRREKGQSDNIILVSEGLNPKDLPHHFDTEKIYPQIERSGIVLKIADKIEHHLSSKPKTVILSYIQRGGTPDIFDIVLANRFANKIVELIHDGKSSLYVGLKGDKINVVPLDSVHKGIRKVTDYYIDMAYKLQMT